MPLYTPGRRRAILLLLLTSVLLLTLDLRGNAVFDAARTGFHKVMEPLESAADVATKPIANAWRGITQWEEVREEVAETLAKLAPCTPVAHQALRRAAECDPDHATRKWAQKALTLATRES